VALKKPTAARNPSTYLTMAERQRTPPRATRSTGQLAQNPPTPEQIRRMEIARLKAKAAAQQAQAKPPPAPVAGAKRTHSSITATNTPPTVRNAAAVSPQKRDQNGMIQPPSNDYIQPAKKYARSEFIDYDFSKMTDTKGGFLSIIDDAKNKAMWKGVNREEQKPEGMTMAAWERERVRRKLRENRSGPFEPGISILNTINGKEEEDEEAALPRSRRKRRSRKRHIQRQMGRRQARHQGQMSRMQQLRNRLEMARHIQRKRM
jgi:DNA-repair protein complementing XP-A cells